MGTNKVQMRPRLSLYWYYPTWIPVPNPSLLISKDSSVKLVQKLLSIYAMTLRKGGTTRLIGRESSLLPPAYALKMVKVEHPR
jgi:hypothetical protein